MKILAVTTDLNCNDGWSTLSYEIVKELTQNNIDVVCAVKKVTPNIDFCEQVRIFKDPLEYIHRTSLLKNLLTSLKYNLIYFKNLVSTIFRFQKLINKEKPHLIHFMVEPYTIVLPFLILNKIKSCMSIIGTYSIFPLVVNRWSRFLAYQYYKRVDAFNSISNFSKKYLVRRFPYLTQLRLDKKIKVITPGISINTLNTKNKNSGIRNEKQILFVGHICFRKGVIETLQAIKEFKKKYNENFKFIIVGLYSENSGYFKNVKKYIEENNLTSNVILKGRVSKEELNEIYDNTHLLIMLSQRNNIYFEGFGLVFIEANARGIPCIGANNCGCKDAIKYGYSGYSINPNNPRLAAEYIKKVLIDKEIIPANCIKWAKQHDIRIRIKDIIKFYLDVLKSPH